jgi:cation transporter-like permease
VVRILILLVVLGVVAWLLTFLPLPPPFPQVIWIVMILCVIWEVLALAGYTNSFLNRRGPPSP